MKINDEALFTILIGIAASIIAFVVVVGGIVCVIDESYTFGAYLSDLTNVWPYLVGAIVAVLLRSLIRTRNGNGKTPP